MGAKKGSEIDYETALKKYYSDQQVKALITLKVDTQYADIIATSVVEHEAVRDVYLVTGDIDIVINAAFDTYNELKRFIVKTLAQTEGVKETNTMMIVTAFKEGGEVIIDEDMLDD